MLAMDELIFYKYRNWAIMCPNVELIKLGKKNIVEKNIHFSFL